jgi:hypothetical protein
MGHDLGMKSRVHPKYKRRKRSFRVYRVGNWAEYDARDRTIMRVKEIGHRRGKKESGYHRQARVETVFFRYKSIMGARLRARHPRSQGSCGR